MTTSMYSLRGVLIPTRKAIAIVNIFFSPQDIFKMDL